MPLRSKKTTFGLGTEHAIPAPPSGGGAVESSFGYSDRADGSAGEVTVLQKVFGVGVLVVLAFSGFWFAFHGQPAASAKPSLFGGSLVLSNGEADSPTVVDLIDGAPTMILTVNEGMGARKDDGDRLKDRRSHLRFVRSTVGDFVVNDKNGQVNLLDDGHLLLNRKTPFRPFVADPNDPDSSSVDGVEPVASDKRVFLVGRRAQDTTVELVDREVIRAAGLPDGQKPKSVKLSAKLAAGSDRAVSAGDDLFLLTVNANGQLDLNRLVPDADPDNLDLKVENHGQFAPDSVLLVADGKVVVVRPSDGLLTVGTGTDKRDVKVPGLAGARGVRPASGDGGRVSMIALTDSGWKLLSVTLADGTTAGPFDIPLGAGADEASAPVMNNGSLYVASRSDGHLVRVNAATGAADPLANNGKYPESTRYDDRPLAGADYATIEVVSRGPRVVVNIPATKRALLYRTDGSGDPVVIRKTEAPEVDPSQPPTPAQASSTVSATSSTNTSVAPGESTTTTQPPPPPPPPETPCGQRDIQPHEPDLSDDYDPAPREVTINWTYKLEDSRDCWPTNYKITITPGRDNTTAKPPEQVAEGSGPTHRVTVKGLRPDRYWNIKVEAYLSGRFAASREIEVKTEVTGPDTPYDVNVSSKQGGWEVTWGHCVAPGCEQDAASWKISASADGCGNPFPPFGKPGDVTIDDARAVKTFIPMSDPSLVATKFRFSVVGSKSGKSSDSAQSAGCAEAWAPPTADGIVLSFDPTKTGDTYSLTLQVRDATMLSPTKTGSQEAQLALYIDTDPPTSGLASANLKAVKTGVQPQTTHTAKAVLSHHGMSVEITANPIDTDPLPYVRPGVTVSKVERDGPDPAGPGFDSAHATLTFTGNLESTFRGSGTRTCGAIVSQFTIPDLPKGSGTVPIAWPNIIEEPVACTLTITLQEVVPPGSKGNYADGEVKVPITGIGTASDITPPTAEIADGVWAPDVQANQGQIVSPGGLWIQTGTAPLGTAPDTRKWEPYGLVTVGITSAHFPPGVTSILLSGFGNCPGPATPGPVVYNGHDCILPNPDGSERTGTVTVRSRYLGNNYVMASKNLSDRTRVEDKPIALVSQAVPPVPGYAPGPTTPTTSSLIPPIVPVAILSRRRRRRRRRGRGRGPHSLS